MSRVFTLTIIAVSLYLGYGLAAGAANAFQNLAVKITLGAR
jgi:hypothetical protein